MAEYQEYTGTHAEIVDKIEIDIYGMYYTILQCRDGNISWSELEERQGLLTGIERDACEVGVYIDDLPVARFERCIRGLNNIEEVLDYTYSKEEFFEHEQIQVEIEWCECNVTYDRILALGVW